VVLLKTDHLRTKYSTSIKMWKALSLCHQTAQANRYENVFSAQNGAAAVTGSFAVQVPQPTIPRNYLLTVEKSKRIHDKSTCFGLHAQSRLVIGRSALVFKTAVIELTASIKRCARFRRSLQKHPLVGIRLWTYTALDLHRGRMTTIQEQHLLLN
jgi:hypothetical protein